MTGCVPERNAGCVPERNAGCVPERNAGCVPERNDSLLETCERVLELVGGRAEAEVTVMDGRTALTRFANSIIHQNVADEILTVRLRVALGGRLASSTTTRLDPAGLAKLVDATLEAAAARPVDPGWPGLTPPRANDEDSSTTAPPHPVAPDRRAEIVAEFIGAGRDHGVHATQAGLEAGYCSTAGYSVIFANSAGCRTAGSTAWATIDGIHRLGGADGSGWQTAAHIADLDGSAAGRTAAAKARRGASPEPLELPPGRYPVVLESACVADMLEFLADGFSAKAHGEGRSFVRLGEAQLDPAITIFDDATDPQAVALPFDAEGTPRRRVDLVVDGVPVGLLHDRRTAATAGVASTGHATPGGESYGPSPSTLFLEPGSNSTADLVTGIDRGLLVTELWYTRILDPKTSVVTGLTRNGTFLIDNGQVTRGVRNLRFTQSYAEALAPGNVLGVGDEAWQRGTEAVVPSLGLAGWNFTGGARG